MTQARITRAVIEVVIQGGEDSIHLTQSVLETLQKPLRGVRVSQVALEVARENLTALVFTRRQPVDTYPSFNQLMPSSSRLSVDDLKVDRSISGDARARAFFVGPKSTLRLYHVLTSLEKEQLNEFYLLHRADPFYVVWQETDTTYAVMFEGPPQYKVNRTDRGGALSVEVSLLEY